MLRVGYNCPLTKITWYASRVNIRFLVHPTAGGTPTKTHSPSVYSKKPNRHLNYHKTRNTEGRFEQAQIRAALEIRLYAHCGNAAHI